MPVTVPSENYIHIEAVTQLSSNVEYKRCMKLIPFLTIQLPVTAEFFEILFVIFFFNYYYLIETMPQFFSMLIKTSAIQSQN